jgi:hypothetical protein
MTGFWPPWRFYIRLRRLCLQQCDEGPDGRTCPPNSASQCCRSCNASGCIDIAGIQQMNMETSVLSTQEILAGKIRTRTAKVGVIGLGYVGLPLAVGKR